MCVNTLNWKPESEQYNIPGWAPPTFRMFLRKTSGSKMVTVAGNRKKMNHKRHQRGRTSKSTNLLYLSSFNWELHHCHCWGKLQGYKRRAGRELNIDEGETALSCSAMQVVTTVGTLQRKMEVPESAHVTPTIILQSRM